MRLLAIFSLSVGFLFAQEPVVSRDWINRGVQQFKSAQYPGAIAAFQRAVELDPANATAHLYLGTAEMQQFVPGLQDPQNSAYAAAAEAQFREVLRIDPSNKAALGMIASLALNQKKWDEAEEWYRKLVAADPGNASAWYSIGFVSWSRWYPAYMQGRMNLGMKLEQPGPLPDGTVKTNLKIQYGQVLENGLQALRQALLINPQYDDAMAYMNLLIREGADLRDTAPDYQRDIAEADQWINRALEVKRQRAGQANNTVAIPGAGSMGISQSMVTSAAAPPPPPPPPPPSSAAPQQAPEIHRIRVGGNVQAAMIIRKVAPAYPADARQAGIQGVVHLSAVIAEDGSMLEVTLLEGPEVLAQSAIDAVRQWVYRPTLLNGRPVEVETTIDVNYTLNQ